MNIPFVERAYADYLPGPTGIVSKKIMEKLVRIMMNVLVTTVQKKTGGKFCQNKTDQNPSNQNPNNKTQRQF